MFLALSRWPSRAPTRRLSREARSLPLDGQTQLPAPVSDGCRAPGTRRYQAHRQAGTARETSEDGFLLQGANICWTVTTQRAGCPPLSRSPHTSSGRGKRASGTRRLVAQRPPPGVCVRTDPTGVTVGHAARHPGAFPIKGQNLRSSRFLRSNLKIETSGNAEAKVTSPTRLVI